MNESKAEEIFIITCTLLFWGCRQMTSISAHTFWKVSGFMGITHMVAPTKPMGVSVET